MCVNLNIEARPFNHCCSGKAMSITQPVCVFVALVIQHAMRKHHIVLWPSPFYRIFPPYLTNGTILENKLLKTKCVFRVPLQLLAETFLFLRTQRDINENVYRS